MHSEADKISEGVTWFTPGVTWLSRAGARAGLLAVVTVICLLTATISPASAKPNKGGTTGTSTDASGGCVDMLAESGTVSLDEARTAIGADHLLDTYGLSGGGIGVAVIDTGINAVTGLGGQKKVVDGPDLSFDALDDDLRHRDLNGHGTNMAAIIAGWKTLSGDGIAPDSHVINVKVGAGDGAVDVSQVIAAIDWVVQNRDINGENIRVINLAFGTDTTQPYQLDPLAHAVENTWKAGIVVVAAGGNDGRGERQLANPALNPFVLAVGASQLENNGGWKVPSWTSTGDGVRNPDIVAPGASVLSSGVAGSYLASTYPTAICGSSELGLRGSGTSRAAAVVSGAAALLLELRPSLTPDQVKYLLTSTAVDLGASPAVQGAGMIDLRAAVEAPIPGSEAIQTHEPSTGLGTLDGARGTAHVGTEGDYLAGEMTAFGGSWDAPGWSAAAGTASAWTDQTYTKGGNVWTGGTWTGSTWTGSTWTGATWSGATWSGATWSGATWSGATWSGATWSGATWSGATWSGATWSGATWSGATWSGATWG